MSIPKISRSFILNLLYLVTITILAFDISPGYTNVFRESDKSLQNSSGIIDISNFAYMRSFKETADENEKYKPVLEAAKKLRQISKEFSDYTDELRTLIAAGDLPLGHPDIYYPANDKRYANQPYNYYDKNITMQILMNEGKKGRALGKKIEETRTALMEVIMDLLRNSKWGKTAEEFEMEYRSQITLLTNDEWKNEGAPSWEHYVFSKMPVALTLSMLSKLKIDAQNTEGTLLGYLSSLVGTYSCILDYYQIVVVPRRNYVLEGNYYEADIHIASGGIRYNWQRAGISVNGTTLTAKNGVATYTSIARGIGTKKYNVSVAMSRRFKEPPIHNNHVFEYEVIRRSVNVAADSMNVFYLGVDNPITISAPDVSSDKVKVSASGPVKIIGSGKNYIVKPTAVGEAVIKVTGPGITQDFKFIVKPIPDPLATLNGKDASGEMDVEEFKAKRGVFPVLFDFDFDARCTIESFEMHRQPKRADALSVKNIGYTFRGPAKELQSTAVSGDLFYFDEVMARCPGDKNARKINSMTWKIR